MNIVAQLIDKKTGGRTPPISCTRSEYANKLRDLLPPDVQGDAYVLVLADDSVKAGSLDFAMAPLMTAERFVENFATFENMEKQHE